MINNSSDTHLIVAIVERGKAETIVKSAKKAGAAGATILYGRGTGESEVKKFLNVYIEASKEIILILTPGNQLQGLMMQMIETGRLKEPGTGIIFSVPINHLTGLHHREAFTDSQ